MDFSGIPNAFSAVSLLRRITTVPPSRLSNLRSNIQDAISYLTTQRTISEEGESLSSQQVSELAAMIGDINREARELLAAPPKDNIDAIEDPQARQQNKTLLLQDEVHIQNIIDNLSQETVPQDSSAILKSLGKALENIKAVIGLPSSYEQTYEEGTVASRDSGDLSSVTDDFGSDHQTGGSRSSNTISTTPSPHMEVNEIDEGKEAKEVKSGQSSSTSYGEMLSDSSWGLEEASEGVRSNSSTQGTEHSLHHTETTASMTSESLSEV